MINLVIRINHLLFYIKYEVKWILQSFLYMLKRISGLANFQKNDGSVPLFIYWTPFLQISKFWSDHSSQLTTGENNTCSSKEDFWFLTSYKNVKVHWKSFNQLRWDKSFSQKEHSWKRKGGGFEFPKCLKKKKKKKRGGFWFFPWKEVRSRIWSSTHKKQLEVWV